MRTRANARTYLVGTKKAAAGYGPAPGYVMNGMDGTESAQGAFSLSNATASGSAATLTAFAPASVGYASVFGFAPGS